MSRIGKFVEPSTGRSLQAGDIVYFNDDINAWDIVPIGTVGQSMKLYYDSYTKLLCHFNGTTGDIPNAETGQTLTYVSGAAVSSVSKKFGLSSLLTNGSSSLVTAPNSADWNFGTDDFTIDFWCNPTSLAANGFIVSLDGDSYDTPGIWGITFNTPGAVSLYANIGTLKTCTSGAIAVGTWSHVAAVRNGNNITMYVNGMAGTPTDVTGGSIGNSTSVLRIGKGFYASVNYWFPGYIDEFRISKGIARWTSNFTPRTLAYALKPQWVT